MLTKLVMPRVMRLRAACKRPSRVRNAAHRAEPMTVPLCDTKKILENYHDDCAFTLHSGNFD